MIYISNELNFHIRKLTKYNLKMGPGNLYYI